MAHLRGIQASEAHHMAFKAHFIHFEVGESACFQFEERKDADITQWAQYSAALTVRARRGESQQTCVSGWR